MSPMYMYATALQLQHSNAAIKNSVQKSVNPDHRKTSVASG